ncbi:MAG TPA: RagB/SusD family nutrient uptake outer membrane protein [Arachidicoccus sp.]|nr:RagB/SusD family nutrient uptake outer membrane protein [Arachidicoccus sp.]
MKKYIFIIIVISLCLTSCQKFLREEFVSGIGYSYYDTETGIEDLVRSEYVPLRAWGGTETGLRMSNFGTDIWEYTNVSSGNEFHMYTSAINPANSNFYSIWSAFYQGISRCNIAINRIPNIQGTKYLMTDVGKNARIGESKFLRGYYYFMLVQIFGKVPLLLDENIGIITDIKRAEVSDVYNAIIADLRYAAEHLPATQTDIARPTQATAWHLLSKVFLTRGSAIKDQRGQRPTDMDSAILYAEKVIRHKNGLVTNFDDSRKNTNQGNSDVLFAVQYTPDLLYDGSGNGSHLYYTIQYMTIGGLTLDMNNGQAWVRLRPTDYLYDLYDLKNDSRFYKAFKTTWLCNTETTIPKWTAADAPASGLVGKPKFAIGDTALYFSMNKGVNQSELNAKSYTWRPRDKFTDRVFPQYQYHLDPFKSSASTLTGTLAFNLMWLSETYLIAAEAYGRKGDYVNGAKYINVVRRRAAYKEGEIKPAQTYRFDGLNVDDLTKSTESSMEITPAEINSFEKLRDFILEERAREFCGDDERFFDLVRTETFYERVVKYNKQCAAFVKPYDKLRPIPQNHIDRLSNPGSMSEEQNEGYY